MAVVVLLTLAVANTILALTLAPWPADVFLLVLAAVCVWTAVTETR